MFPIYFKGNASNIINDNDNQIIGTGRKGDNLVQRNIEAILVDGFHFQCEKLKKKKNRIK